MLKPPIVRPKVEVPTILKVEYYEVVLPNGHLLIDRDGRGNFKCAFDDVEEAERAIHQYFKAEGRRRDRAEQRRVESAQAEL